MSVEHKQAQEERGGGHGGLDYHELHPIDNKVCNIFLIESESQSRLYIQ